MSGSRIFQTENAILGVHPHIESVGDSKTLIPWSVTKKILGVPGKDSCLMGQLCIKQRASGGMEREF